jgi:hypothetical protein
VGQCVAGLLIWFFCSALIWNVSHRMLGYSEGFAEIARVLAFACAPLLGVWLTVLPIAGLGAWLSIGLHGLAFVNLVLATQTILSTSTLRAVGICALSVAAGALLFFVLGLLFVGRPASEEIVAVLVRA